MSRIESRMMLTGPECVKMLGIAPSKFLRMQDAGRIKPELVEGKVLYNFTEIRKFRTVQDRPFGFPDNEYATVEQAMAKLDISRRTFYKRVASGEIEIHKDGRLSFVKLVDLYANDDLF